MKELCEHEYCKDRDCHCVCHDNDKENARDYNLESEFD